MSSENDTESEAEKPCPRCEGCGQLANDDDRTPWTFWAELHPPSNMAVTLGLVRPEPCDQCSGTGKAISKSAGEQQADLTALDDEICRTYGAIHAPDNLADILARHGWVQANQHRQQVAEEIAAALDAVPGRVYPEDIFTPDGTTIDAQSARVMRCAYPAPADLAREIGAQA